MRLEETSQGTVNRPGTNLQMWRNGFQQCLYKPSLGKSYKSLVTLIPKMAARAETVAQRQTVHLGKDGIVFDSFGKAIERNSAAQMMNVVQANVCREPAKNGR